MNGYSCPHQTGGEDWVPNVDGLYAYQGVTANGHAYYRGLRHANYLYYTAGCGGMDFDVWGVFLQLPLRE